MTSLKYRRLKWIGMWFVQICIIIIDVAKNLHDVQKRLPDDICLVAISKYHPKEMIVSAYAARRYVFGENREQELTEKAGTLPNDIE